MKINTIYTIVILFIKKFGNFLNQRMLETEENIKLFGLLTLFGYAIFSVKGISSYAQSYENLILRVIAILLAFPLVFYHRWPSILHNIKPIYWYVSITYILPFFFTFMLLHNNGNAEWELNSVIILSLLMLLLDWISFALVSIIGIFLGSVTYYLTTENPVLPNNYQALLNVIGSLLIYHALFSRKKENITRKRKLLLEETQLNNILLEDKVNERTKKLQDALNAKTVFLNNISHEVRTPVQGVLGISEGLVENWEKYDTSQRLYYTKKIAQNAHRLLSLVSNLLDLSRFSSGKMTFDLKESDLIPLINDMIREFQDLYFQKKHLAFHFSHENITHAWIMGDDGRIMQLLRNLFGNAVKFSNSDINIALTFCSRSFQETSNRHDEWYLTISDKGIGIPQSEIESIFNPFVQSSRTYTKAGGTGLGLAICKEIIESHEGKIWATNNEKEGVTMHFTLPAVPYKKLREEQKTLEENIHRSDTKNFFTVLIIDDEEGCLLSMEMILESQGNIHCIKAAGGYEGLKYVEDKYDKIDIILLDLMMPDIYGLNVLENIRSKDNTRHIPVILQSGTSDTKEVKKAEDLGIVGFISKPYTRKDVLKVINNFLIVK